MPGTPAANYSATLGALRVDGADSRLAVAPGASSATVTFASLEHVSGTFDITADGLGTTTKIFITGQPNGLIGPWATVNGGTDLAAYSSTEGIHAANLPAQTLSALGPSVINDNAGETAHITTAGTTGGITLGANPTAVALLSQETATEAVVTFGGATLAAPRVQIADGAAGLTLGTVPGDGVLTSPHPWATGSFWRMQMRPAGRRSPSMLRCRTTARTWCGLIRQAPAMSV